MRFLGLGFFSIPIVEDKPMEFVFTLALIALPLYCAPALAGTWSLQVSGFAYHYDREMVARLELHEVNPGLAIAYEDGKRVTTFGGYENSYGEASYYYFTGWEWHITGWLRTGVMAGIVSGYEVDIGYPLTPAVVPFISIGAFNFIASPWFAAANTTVARF